MAANPNTLAAGRPAVSTGEDLKSVIDALATRLMVESDVNAVSALRTIADDASTLGLTACAATAKSLLAACQADPAAGAAQLLKSGLGQLRADIDAAGKPESTGGPSSFGEDAELVGDFLVESREHLSQIEGQMLVLERDPSAMEVIHAVFRAFHTIKGLAGFLDFQIIREVAHEVETLLDLARNEKLKVDSAVVDIVLESGDFLQKEINAVEVTLQSGTPLVVGNHLDLLGRIRTVAAAPAVSAVVAAEPVMDDKPAKTAKPVKKTVKSAKPVSAAKAEVKTVPVEVSLNVVTMSSAAENATDAAPAVAAPVAVEAAVPRPAAAKEPVRTADAGSVRVETAKLDHLMNMVGEIVIAQSLIRHNPVLAMATDSRLLGDLSQLARVTAEVQRATMSMRMIPIGQLFQRIERVIRDLSRKAGKHVILETAGTETEIDKTVAEELADPLLHMVRNSVDHGIELPADRVAAGKSQEARIRLSASHQGGQIVIEISDDGRGLDSTRIRRKAEERQLIQPGALLTDSEVYQLIFEPGFSTAEAITELSGRGVGMDVVRRNVEKLRGRIDTSSVPGAGTTFLLKLPLTLAIIDGLVVQVGQHSYIIPLSGVREIFRPKPDTLFTIEGRDEVVMVREELMAMVRLHERLRVEPRLTNPSEGLLVVLESENKRFCLLVDDLLGKQEVVIKNLGEAFKDAPGVSGCAVLGDGQVGLILDIDGIFRGRRR